MVVKPGHRRSGAGGDCRADLKVEASARSDGSVSPCLRGAREKVSGARIEAAKSGAEQLAAACCVAVTQGLWLHPMPTTPSEADDDREAEGRGYWMRSVAPALRCIRRATSR